MFSTNSIHKSTIICDGVKIGVPPFMLGFGNPFRISRVDSQMIKKLQLGQEIEFALIQAVKEKSPRMLLETALLSSYIDRYLSDCETNRVEPLANLLK